MKQHLENTFTSFDNGSHHRLFGFCAGVETSSDLNFHASADAGAFDGCNRHS